MLTICQLIMLRVMRLKLRALRLNIDTHPIRQNINTHPIRQNIKTHHIAHALLESVFNTTTSFHPLTLPSTAAFLHIVIKVGHHLLINTSFMPSSPSHHIECQIHTPHCPPLHEAPSLRIAFIFLPLPPHKHNALLLRATSRISMPVFTVYSTHACTVHTMHIYIYIYI